MAPFYAALVLCAFFAACSPRPKAIAPAAQAPEAILPNVHVFSEPLDRVWEALTNAVQFRMLLPLEVQNKEQGQFATKLIQDDQEPFKFRLTGKIEKTPQGFAVTLYKDQQIWTGQEWKTEPSDFKLERDIFNWVKKDLIRR